MISYDSLKKNMLYVISYISLIFWSFVLYFCTEKTNQLHLYIILQIVLYSIIVVDSIKKRLQPILHVVYVIYKVITFLCCLSWLYSISNLEFFNNVGTKWITFSLTTKIICSDLILTLVYLSSMVLFVAFMCIGCFFMMCISPCVNIHFDKEVVDIEKAFKKCSDNEYNSNDFCVICLSEYNDTTICSTECGHMYHSKCIKDWFSNDKSTCPLCKSEFYKKKKIIIIEKRIL